MWLADLIDRLAGKPDAATAPLTFGDLWGNDPNTMSIDLQMITSCISQGKPYRLPIETRGFYFDPNEMRKLFPERIVRWMEEHPREYKQGNDAETEKKNVNIGVLRRMPAPRDLPVVVAARMSLSFPILISAVPLYAVDHARKPDASNRRTPERCWFSDGGLSSNFPIHLFDEAVPKWPVFALNLRKFHPDYPKNEDDKQNVRVAKRMQDGMMPSWNRWEENSSSISSVIGFATALFDTLQNWKDTVQMGVPGFRDRIGHVSLDADEGGLALNMPATTIESLSNRGAHVATLLAERYSHPGNTGEVSWSNHRWTRIRLSLSSLQKMLRDMRGRLGTSAVPGTEYSLFVDAADNHSILSYSSPKKRMSVLGNAAMELMDLSQKWDDSHINFEEGGPHPETELRPTPPI